MIQPKTKINKKKREIQRERIVTGFIFLVLAFAIFVLFFTAKSILLPQKTISEQASTLIKSSSMQKISMMSLTAYDRELGVKSMDKGNDGRCDVCGMDVEVCLDSGQIECNMDSKSTIGVLGSQHIHADWKIYINGKVLDNAFFEPISMDMSKQDNKITSSFIHMDKGAPAPEKTGDLIHMHATGVPLWIFFKSVGIEFNKDCLSLPDGQEFCNDGKNTLKFYINGKPNEEYEKYVFNDSDNILIGYGNKNEDVSSQLNSITDYSKNH